MNCKQLDVYSKFKIRLDNEGRIIFVDDDFMKFTGFDIDDLIGENFSALFKQEFVDGEYDQMLFPLMKENPKMYFIINGRMKDGDCYWAVVRSTHYTSPGSDKVKFLWEMKMIPETVIPALEELFGKLIEIRNSAGQKYAMKYFLGYMEDKGIDLNNFALSMLDTKEKKLDKYFQI